MLKFKRELINEQTIKSLESLRYEVFDMDESKLPCDRSLSANQFRRKQLLAYTAYLDDDLVAACYISNAFHSLFVEQLFVKKDYQQKGLNIGKQLLNYVLNDKKYIESYFKQAYVISCLTTKNKKLEKYYEQLGYKRINDLYMMKTI